MASPKKKGNNPLIQNSFDTFNPRAYLNEYYSKVGEENREILNFLHTAYEEIFNQIREAKLLELGGGPTIYQLISVGKHPVVIDFSDYLDQNLAEVKLWLKDNKKKHDWNKFIRYVLSKEGLGKDQNTVRKRAQLMRQKIRHLLHCDIKQPNPLGSHHCKQYNIVSVNFVAESITSKLDKWAAVIDNILLLIKPNGYLIMCAIVEAQCYRVGDSFFQAVPVSSQDIIRKLEKENMSIIDTHFVKAEQKEEQGYDGIFMLLAKRD